MTTYHVIRHDTAQPLDLSITVLVPLSTSLDIQEKPVSHRQVFSPRNAPLPVVYQEAKEALARCDSIDECKDWSNKATALASYGKQAKDETLFQMAFRIKARAIRRCGELLKEYDARGGDPKTKSIPEHTFETSQRQAAEKAGLSKNQQMKAVRVANVPQEEFEQAVESDHPPTVHELAERGKKPQPKPLVDLEGIDPEDYRISTQGQGGLSYFADDLQAWDPVIVVRGSKAYEHPAMRDNVAIVRRWLDQLIIHLDSLKETPCPTPKKISPMKSNS